MFSLILVVLLSSPAWAICDLDGDGFDGFHFPACTGPRPDCDDADASVSPAESEVMSDGVDNDCDDLTDIIRRPYFVGFWGGMHPEWTYTMGTWGNSELVHIGPGNALRLNGLIPWESGKPNFGMMVRRNAATSCTLLASGAFGVPCPVNQPRRSEWVDRVTFVRSEQVAWNLGRFAGQRTPARA